ncbi:hypothetical protein L211DRAFT_852934 [Terfezia boudieri ATCC MYA-4762]|uniref:Uncharacterized protein n=1 Tax=Terfezia boudieri ATCC MYA-4762 TaxID=1051890 RepID=A0A3N4LA56_9PEZI|nr:hypothetical protein L211DRAFT_852934 [Terfezia boudieri ATCC MYA-4762]
MRLFEDRNADAAGGRAVFLVPTNWARCVESPIGPGIDPGIWGFPFYIPPANYVFFANTAESESLAVPKLKELWLTALFKEYNPLKVRLMSIVPGMKNEGTTLFNITRWQLFNRLMDKAGSDLIPDYTRNYHPFCVLTAGTQTENCKQLEDAFRAEFIEMMFEEIQDESNGCTIYQLRRGLVPEPPHMLELHLFGNSLLESNLSVLQGEGEWQKPFEVITGNQCSASREWTVLGEIRFVHSPASATQVSSTSVVAVSTTPQIAHAQVQDSSGGDGSDHSDHSSSENKPRSTKCEDAKTPNEVPKWERFWHSVNIEEHLFTDPVEVVWGEAPQGGNIGT